MDNIRVIGKAEPSPVEKVFIAARKDAETTGCTRVVVILLNTDDDTFNHRSFSCGLLNSEQVALLEVAKLNVIDAMNGNSTARTL